MGPFAQTIRIVRPSTVTDRYGNAVRDYDNPVWEWKGPAWMQQDSSSTTVEDSRSPRARRYLAMVQIPGVDLEGTEKVYWEMPGGKLIEFVLDGPAEPAFTPSAYHHHEISLRRVDG